MKLARCGPRSAEKPARVDGQGVLRDLGGVLADITPDWLAEPALARLRGRSTEIGAGLLAGRSYGAD